jgi:hypothetical protein
MWRVGDRVYPVWPDGPDPTDIAEVIRVSDDGWSKVHWLSDTVESLVSPVGKTQDGAMLKPIPCKNAPAVV